MAMLKLLDQETGQMLPMITDKKLLKEAVLKLSDKDKGELLTNVNFVKRVMDNTEKAIKEYVKPMIELDENGEFMFESWKITEKTQQRFSEKALIEKADPKDLKIWAKLKQKYAVPVSSYNFK